jgi:hypothetical protein
MTAPPLTDPTHFAERRQRAIDHHMKALTAAMLALRGLGASEPLRVRLQDELADMLGERAVRTGRKCAQPLRSLAGAFGCPLTHPARAPATDASDASPRDVLRFPPSASRLHGPDAEGGHPKGQER